MWSYSKFATITDDYVFKVGGWWEENLQIVTIGQMITTEFAEVVAL